MHVLIPLKIDKCSQLFRHPVVFVVVAATGFSQLLRAMALQRGIPKPFQKQPPKPTQLKRHAAVAASAGVATAAAARVLRYLVRWRPPVRYEFPRNSDLTG